MSEHNHGDAHAHAPTNCNKAFAIGIALNITFVAVEAFYGWKVNSLALQADAAHSSAWRPESASPMRTSSADELMRR